MIATYLRNWTIACESLTNESIKSSLKRGRLLDLYISKICKILIVLIASTRKCKILMGIFEFTGNPMYVHMNLHPVMVHWFESPRSSYDSFQYITGWKMTVIFIGSRIYLCSRKWKCNTWNIFTSDSRDISDRVLRTDWSMFRETCINISA